MDLIIASREYMGTVGHELDLYHKYKYKVVNLDHPNDGMPYSYGNVFYADDTFISDSDCENALELMDNFVLRVAEGELRRAANIIE